MYHCVTVTVTVALLGTAETTSTVAPTAGRATCPTTPPDVLKEYITSPVRTIDRWHSWKNATQMPAAIAQLTYPGEEQLVCEVKLPAGGGLQGKALGGPRGFDLRGSAFSPLGCA